MNWFYWVSVKKLVHIPDLRILLVIPLGKWGVALMRKS